MFRIGQKVVCVDASGFRQRECETFPKQGHVYTIREFYDGDCIRLDELRNPLIYWGGTQEAAFYIRRFRPVVERKTDIAIFRTILDDVSKGHVREIA